MDAIGVSERTCARTSRLYLGLSFFLYQKRNSRSTTSENQAVTKLAGYAQYPMERGFGRRSLDGSS